MFIVTGGAGFIGSALVKMLNEQFKTKEIVIVDELGTSIKWKNLRKRSFYEYIHKDYFLTELKKSFNCDDIQAIIHMGACSDTTENNMDYLYDTNTLYSTELLYYALDNEIPFIYASSASIYGDGNKGFKDDEKKHDEYTPLNRYGFSKWLFDNHVINNSQFKNVVGLRFFNVYGPNEYHKDNMSSVIYKAYHQIKKEGKVKLFKSYKDGIKHGEQKRDFVYVKDVVNVISYFIKNKNKSGIYNIGSGVANSFNSLVEYLFESLNMENKIEYIEMPDDIKNQYQYYTESDISKLRKIGYKKDFCSLKEGIFDYVKNYLEKEDQYI